jgi:hypothetical protein
VLLIGGVPVPYTTPTPTTIVAVTPPHEPGPVSIELRPGIGSVGTPSVLVNAFTYVGSGIPTLSGLAMMSLAALLGLAGVFALYRSGW